MKKLNLFILALVCFATQLTAQCTFETLFPLKWGAAKYAINEKYNNDSTFNKGKDTIQGSVFQHGLNYFFTVRNMNLDIFSYTNTATHPCFKSGDVILNCVANDSGLVAYNYQVTFPASKKAEFMAVVDSLKAMMAKQFTYQSAVENKTVASDPAGNKLEGDGVCVYFNDHPIVPTNLTYAQFVIRAGYLAKKPAATSNNKVLINQAEDVQYYRIEILYKRPQPTWK